MKGYKVYIDSQTIGEGGMTERHVIDYVSEFENMDQALKQFMNDHFEIFKIGPNDFDVISFKIAGVHTMIPLNRVVQFEIREVTQ